MPDRMRDGVSRLLSEHHVRARGWVVWMLRFGWVLWLLLPLTGGCGADDEPSAIDEALATGDELAQTLVGLVQRLCTCLPDLPLDDCIAASTMLELVPLTPECRREGIAIDPEGTLDALRCQLAELQPLVECVEAAGDNCIGMFACQDDFLTTRDPEACVLPDGVLDAQVAACTDAGLH